MPLPRSPLLRATLTLIAGGAVAQALPLIAGPLLTRLYSPAQFGLYHLFAAVAANLGVVACARYEFALPLARDADEAGALLALSMWLLAASTALSALIALAWAMSIGQAWPLALPLAVLALGGLSLATLAATREQRFKALAAARVVQHGGGAIGQVGAGLASAGLAGLIAAPLLAALAAAALLRPKLRRWWLRSRNDLRAVSSRYRDFPLLNTPHAFAGALQDTLSVALIAATHGAAAAGFWGLALRYLKAPATLVGSAVSQALYPALAAGIAETPAMLATPAGRASLRRVMAVLALIALPMVALLWAFGPRLFAWAFGEEWRVAGELARSLGLYVGVHFVASPLAVATMAWQAQAWALKLALLGQVCFVAALALGLALGGLSTAGWCVSLAMGAYFGYYFWRLAHWPVPTPAASPQAAR